MESIPIGSQVEADRFVFNVVDASIFKHSSARQSMSTSSYPEGDAEQTKDQLNGNCNY